MKQLPTRSLWQGRNQSTAKAKRDWESHLGVLEAVRPLEQRTTLIEKINDAKEYQAWHTYESRSLEPFPMESFEPRGVNGLLSPPSFFPTSSPSPSPSCLFSSPLISLLDPLSFDADLSSCAFCSTAAILFCLYAWKACHGGGAEGVEGGG